MNRSVTILAGTVVCFVLLFGYRDRFRINRNEQEQEHTSSAAREQTTANSNSPSSSILVPTNSPWTWSDLNGSNYSQYIASLRSVKCPEPTITSLVIGDVNKVYRQHLVNLRSQFRTTNQVKYWTATSRGKGRGTIFTWRQTEDAVNGQRIAAIKEYIATDIPPEAIQPIRLNIDSEDESGQDRLSFLSREQADLLRSGLDAVQANLRHLSATGVNGQELLEEMDKQQRGLYQKMASQVTPEQLLEIKARTCSLSERLKEELAYLEPTEEEYLKIFREFDKAGEQYPDRIIANEIAKQQVKQILSPDRYSEFDRSRSTAFQSIAGFVEGNGMQIESANSLYDVYLEMVSDSSRDQSSLPQKLTDYQRRAQEILGDNYERFASTPKGAWLTGNVHPIDSSNVRYGVAIPPP